jgi:hypothetical protein
VTENESYSVPVNWAWVRLGQIVEVLDRLRKPVTKHNRKPDNEYQQRFYLIFPVKIEEL